MLIKINKEKFSGIFKRIGNHLQSIKNQKNSENIDNIMNGISDSLSDIENKIGYDELNLKCDDNKNTITLHGNGIFDNKLALTFADKRLYNTVLRECEFLGTPLYEKFFYH